MGRRILFLVHPGSACRSADDNLGVAEASAARLRLVEHLNGWDGGIVVIDGRLSRDLGTRKFYDLGTAIGGALDRAQKAGLPSLQIMGCDQSVVRDQTWATQRAVESLGLSDADTIEVTGAWYDTFEQVGCVNDVLRALKRHGIDASPSDSAVLAPEFHESRPTKPPAGKIL